MREKEVNRDSKEKKAYVTPKAVEVQFSISSIIVTSGGHGEGDHPYEKD